MSETLGGSIPFNFDNLNAGECNTGYAMVLMQGNAEDQDRKRARKSKFQIMLVIEEEEHKPIKASFIPQSLDQDTRRATKIKYQKQAYELHMDVNELESNFAENAHSFLCQGTTLRKLSDSGKKASSVKVGADCSGIGVVLIALKNMGVKFRHTFDCDNCPEVQKTIQANHDPEIFYPDIQGKGVKEMPYTDVYVAGFPCQPFSAMGKQESFEDTLGRGKIFFYILEYIIGGWGVSPTGKSFRVVRACACSLYP